MAVASLRLFLDLFGRKLTLIIQFLEDRPIFGQFVGFCWLHENDWQVGWVEQRNPIRLGRIQPNLRYEKAAADFRTKPNLNKIVK